MAGGVQTSTAAAGSVAACLETETYPCRPKQTRRPGPTQRTPPHPCPPLQVAVKVQRPGVLETVTIDLYIIRKIGIFLRRFPAVRHPRPWSSKGFGPRKAAARPRTASHHFALWAAGESTAARDSQRPAPHARPPPLPPRPNPQITTDFVALLDEWAARFFEELDYVREGENATRFAAQMAADLPQVGDGLAAALPAEDGRRGPPLPRVALRQG
jgi:hypothetical protein